MVHPAFSFDPTDVLLRLNDGVLVADAQRVVQFANQRAGQHLGANVEALLGQPVDCLFASRQLPLPPLDGSVTHNNTLAISARPLPGVIAGRQREGTLYLISDRPADSARQRDFLLSLAHQLRTPLTVIRGMSELLLRGRAGPAKRDQDELLGVITARAIDLSTLVNHLIVIANLEAGHNHAEAGWVDLRERLEATLTYLVHSRQLPRHELHYQIAPAATRLWIDLDGLRHILEGLLSNALVVAPQESQISIVASCADGCFKLEVCDSGQPIPAAQRRRVFEHWAYIPRTPDGTSRGCGLEVALARTVAEHCGGTISYEPTTGQGNCWVLRLPQPPG